MSKMIKVLLVEDDETTNFLSKMVLKHVGIQKVEAVLNGKAACEYLSKVCPDIIFLDLNMPVMDGWSFLDEKMNGNYCPKVKIALLTSSIRSRDRERALKYECVVDYLEKPLTREKVEAVINRRLA